MKGMTGLTGLAGLQQQIDTQAQATPEERYGGPADSRHAQIGEQASPYPWQSQMIQAGGHGPYGPQNELLDDIFWFQTPAGDISDDPTMDTTPSTGAAPWPKGILSGPIAGVDPDATAEKLRQSYEIHGIRNQAGYKGIYPAQAIGIQNDEWTEIWEVDPGNSDLVPIPKQMMSSGFMWGTRDRTQSMAAQNGYGFDSRHMHRRFATGAIPGNTMWLKPGGRPMAKSLPGPARPAIGPDSPFEGNDLGSAFDPRGALLMNTPTEYSSPAQPNLAPPLNTLPQDDGGAYVEWY